MECSVNQLSAAFVSDFDEYPSGIDRNSVTIYQNNVSMVVIMEFVKQIDIMPKKEYIFAYLDIFTNPLNCIQLAFFTFLDQFFLNIYYTSYHEYDQNPTSRVLTITLA